MPSLGRPALRLFAAAALLLVGLGTCADAQMPLFFEDFESLPLGPNVDEPISFPEAFTHDPPSGWERFDQVPGIGNPTLGVAEWEGWSFASSDFWQFAADGPVPTGREQFTRGQGTIAVADPDQWNDLGDPANSSDGGFYNTLLQTPFIDVTPAEEPGVRLKLGFDSTWNGGGCCDDGRHFSGPELPPPFSNNQTAFVQLRFEDGSTFEILRWEAAPFIHQQTGQPLPDGGPNAVPNPFFRAPNLDERVWLDLNPQQIAVVEAAVAAAGGAGMGSVQVEFGMENAGDDGWWGIDNVEMLVVSTVLGDMNINGVLDTGDVDAFALGLLDADEYLTTYFGEFPVTRGSPDGTFDFDDIDWFVNVLENGGVDTSAAAIAAIIAGAPEPSALVLAGLSLGIVSGRQRSVAG